MTLQSTLRYKVDMNLQQNQQEADDSARDLAQMLDLAEAQRRIVAGRMGAFVPVILLSWGIAWVAGFLVLWSIDRPAGFSLPVAIAAPLVIGLFLAAGAVSTVLGVRMGRGVRAGQTSTFRGIVYGQAWWVGSIAIWLLGTALVQNGMDAALLSIYFPSAYVFFVGLMYGMGGIIWKSSAMVILGGWSVVVSAVAPFFGAPTNHLVFAIAGGGGFLVASLVSFLWLRGALARTGHAR